MKNPFKNHLRLRLACLWLFTACQKAKVIQNYKGKTSAKPISNDDETNGLTLAGVVTNITIHHVQVSCCNNDGFEFFGGSVSATFLVSWHCSDDDFDSNLGHTEKLTMMLVETQALAVLASSGYSNVRNSIAAQVQLGASNLVSIVGLSSLAYETGTNPDSGTNLAGIPDFTLVQRAANLSNAVTLSTDVVNRILVQENFRRAFGTDGTVTGGN